MPMPRTPPCLGIYWLGPMIGGPLGAALHYFPLQYGATDDTKRTKAVNMGGDVASGEEPQQKKSWRRSKHQASAPAENDTGVGNDGDVAKSDMA